MSEVAVARVEKGGWDPALIEGMERLAASVLGPDPTVLADELLRGDRLYVARDPQGLAAFMLVARVRLPVGAECRHARYLGLTVARQDEGGSAAARGVRARLISDARAEEARLRRGLLLFSTAATPGALCTARAFWGEVQPAHDTAYPDDLVPAAEAAAHWLGARPGRQLPFVLQGLDPVWRRAQSFPGRIATDRLRRELDLLQHFGVDESNGDRLLLFCSLPKESVLSEAEAA